MEQFYFELEGQRKGPISIEELNKVVVDPNTLVWKAGLANWVPAIQLPEWSVNQHPPLPPSLPNSVDQLKLKENVEPKAKQESNSSFTKYLVLGIILFLSVGVVVVYLNNNSSVYEPYQPSEAASPGSTYGGQTGPDYSSYINNVQKFVTVAEPSVIFKILGGMDPFNLYVTNELPFTAELVELEVYYYKADGDVFKSETVVLHNITKDNYSSAIAPGSERGTSVQVYLKRVKCISLGIDETYQ